MNVEDRYDVFEAKMADLFPRYCGEDACFGGYAVGEGWYPIIETLVEQIDTYTRWKRKMRVYDLRIARAKAKGRDAVLKHITKGGKLATQWDEDSADHIMEHEQTITPKVNWIQIQQIKYKFGGLRFYYDCGDDYIAGLVTMAETWAGRTCETCGDKGIRRGGGWIRTLCDAHEAEHQEKNKKFSDEYYG